MAATTTTAAPHTKLIKTLRNHGWSTTGTEPSALITGLSTTTLTAPIGDLSVRIEAVGTLAALTLTANAPEGWQDGRYYLPWRATAPVLSARDLEKLAHAGEEARLGNERGTDVEELVRHLKPKGWKLTEHSSHDQPARGRLTSYDGTRQISWGPDEETWRITDATTHTVITADDATPITVLRVIAGVD